MIAFTIYGHPEPQGSTRAFIPKGWKRPIITTANPKMKPWRQQIAGVAFDMVGQPFDRSIPVEVWLHFFLAKPKSTARKVWAHTTKPDIDKLARAVMDALTGPLVTDDSQIAKLHLTKDYGIPERVEIEVRVCESSEKLF